MTTQWSDHSAFSDALAKRGIKWPLGFYAPGNYHKRCTSCGEQVYGVDKGALLCLPCEIAAQLRHLDRHRAEKTEVEVKTRSQTADLLRAMADEMEGKPS